MKTKLKNNILLEELEDDFQGVFISACEGRSQTVPPNEFLDDADSYIRCFRSDRHLHTRNKRILEDSQRTEQEHITAITTVRQTD